MKIALYAYDAVGNRIGSSQQTGTWQYNQDNQLTQQGQGKEKTSYTYTATDNIATETQGETTKTYTYDASDRLIRITSTANGTETEVARYAYDPMGRRIAKTVNGNTSYYLYTDEGLIAELNQQGQLTKAYGWLADTSYSTSPLWQAEPKAGQTTISDLKQAQFHTMTTDHLGTVQMATNEAGQVTWKAQSEAFGKTTPDEQNQITMNLRFQGQYFDEETGTHYNYFRGYQPTTGRYIQRDPIGLAGGINSYGYVLADPMQLLDPLGLKVTGRWKRNISYSVSFPSMHDVKFDLLGLKITSWGNVGIFNIDFIATIHFTGEVECEDDCTKEKWSININLDVAKNFSTKAGPNVIVAALSGGATLATYLEFRSIVFTIALSDAFIDANEKISQAINSRSNWLNPTKICELGPQSVLTEIQAAVSLIDGNLSPGVSAADYLDTMGKARIQGYTPGSTEPRFWY